MRRSAREGNTLSGVLRQAWEGDDLATLTRASLHATAPGEFRLYATGTDMAGGNYNRFLPIYSERSKEIPDGDGAPDDLIATLAAQLRELAKQARNMRRIPLNDHARDCWAEKVVLFDQEETQRLFDMAMSQRNGVRFIMALVTGLRQGEVLGLRWSDIDLDAGVLEVERQRLWPEYVHGCGETPCGRKHAGYCPSWVNTQPETGDVKSEAGNRPFPLPDALVTLLKAHKAAQDAERQAAEPLWTEGGWVFATDEGEILHPRSD